MSKHTYMTHVNQALAMITSAYKRCSGGITWHNASEKYMTCFMFLSLSVDLSKYFHSGIDVFVGVTNPTVENSYSVSPQMAYRLPNTASDRNAALLIILSIFIGANFGGYQNRPNMLPSYYCACHFDGHHLPDDRWALLHLLLGTHCHLLC